MEDVFNTLSSYNLRWSKFWICFYMLFYLHRLLSSKTCIFHYLQFPIQLWRTNKLYLPQPPQLLSNPILPLLFLFLTLLLYVLFKISHASSSSLVPLSVLTSLPLFMIAFTALVVGNNVPFPILLIFFLFFFLFLQCKLYSCFWIDASLASFDRL